MSAMICVVRALALDATYAAASLATVPEPTSAALLLVGLLAVAGSTVRQRRAA